ncbi:RNA polymerase sigma factor [Paenibacillus alkalitolerans]|uniref:RNA polymerase sigma factor n=1 Tax=Paenibacillus alkalitolerans TaxID=2799335 RepID=UPI0018F28DA7|nr:sigma-70 family RNA polymerase sigma factor [Paenibacillus alkalitolerans]
MEVPDERRLIEAARAGDRDAFSELVRRNRTKVLGFAASLTRDRHLAEDVLQEAFLRAFLHLGSLQDSDKFVPWLHQIVRNEAYMRLRRGGPYAKERPFTSLESSVKAGTAHMESRRDFRDAFHANPIGNPEERLARRMFWDWAEQLMETLTEREKHVFQAYVFRELEPHEIAELLSVGTNHVYNTLSASRQKVREQKERIRLNEYLHDRERERTQGRSENNGTIVLTVHSKRLNADWKRCALSIGVCLRHSLDALVQTGGGEKDGTRGLLAFKQKPKDRKEQKDPREPKAYSLADVMGLSALAFRNTVEVERIDASGPWSFFWETVFTDAARNLGAECDLLGDGGVFPSPGLLYDGVAFVREALREKRPVIAWDLFTPEFGLIYGMDEGKRQVHAHDPRARRSLPFAALGRGSSGGLFLMSLRKPDKPVIPDRTRQLDCALGMAVRHAYGERGLTGYVSGLAAYFAWIDALRSGRIDPVGSAYCAMLTADARRWAAKFLNEAGRAAAGECSRLLQEAALLYNDTAEAWMNYCRLFPFPSGGKPHDRAEAAAGIELLGSAYEAEASAVERLERVRRLLPLFHP